MSAITRTHRPTSASPRLSRTRGIEVPRGDGTVYTQDRTRWDSSTLGTFRHDAPIDPYYEAESAYDTLGIEG